MKSYLKFLSRNKLYTFIEVVGLSISLAFVILIGSYISQQIAVTREHPNRKSVYVLGMPDCYGLTYGLNDVLSERIPEIEEIARFSGPLDVMVDIKGEKLSVLADAVEKSFFDIFPYYHFVEGAPEVLDSKNAVVVSRRFATAHNLKIGQMLQIKNTDMTVSAIIEDFQNTLFPYVDIITSADNIINKASYEMPFDRYGSTIPIVKLRQGVDPEDFYKKAESVCKEVYGEFYGCAFFGHLEMTRLDKIFFNTLGRWGQKQFNSGSRDSMKLLFIVGVLLLLSSVFNYINLNVALTGKRAKEMATRRLMGASKGGVFGKYILESVVFTAMCFGMAILIAVAFLPVMNEFLNDPDVRIRIQFDFLNVLAFLLLIVVVGGLTGLLPAWFATRFQPIDVVKGSFRVLNKMVFSKIFIALQNALAVFLIALTLVMEAQYHTSLHRPVHADIADKYYLMALIDADQGTLRDELAMLPCVNRVGKARGVPGVNPGRQYSTTLDGEEIMYCLYRFDSTAFAMLDFEKQKDFGTPLYNNVWFGEKAFMANGFDDVFHDVSNTLAQRTQGCELVAGVYTDFPIRNDNLGDEGYQVVSVQKSEDFWGGWLIETKGNHAEAERQIKDTYKKWCMDRLGYDLEANYSFYLTDNFHEGLRPTKNNMRLLEVFMFLAVLISLLGLVAMSTYYASENAKSIAVRKVFGGTIETETRRNVRAYLILVAVACVVGAPVAVWAARKYLEGFIFKLENYAWIFVVAVIIAMLMAFFSVLWQILKVARVNPVDVLQKE